MPKKPASSSTPAIRDVLLTRAAKAPALKKRLAALSKASPAAPTVFDHVDQAAHALIAALMARSAKSPTRHLWLACSNVKTQERMHAELAVWGIDALFLPEQDILGFDDALPDPESLAERLSALQHIHGAKETRVIVTCAECFEELAPPPGSLDDHSMEIAVGDTLDLTAMSDRMIDNGFEKVVQVFQRGQFAVRGGILDLFPWQSPRPLRIELFDREIESIREFDVDEQTSVARIDKAEILFSTEDENNNGVAPGTVRDYVDEKRDLVIAVDVDPEPLAARAVITSEGVLLEDDGAEDFSTACFGSPLGTFDAGDFILQESRRAEFDKQMNEWRRKSWTVAMSFNSQGEIDRFRELLADETKIIDSGALQIFMGQLSHGFTVPAAKLAMLCDAELFGRYQHQRARRKFNSEQKRRLTQRQTDISEFRIGDLVVHANHGIGKFRGIQQREHENKHGDTETEEVLAIEYANQARLYVPLEQAHLVSRYIGGGKGKKGPTLHQLGGNRWSKTKADAQRSILDYASQLLAVQAERQTHVGYAHPPDNQWQWEFENAFVYKETPDQLAGIEASKADMESHKPMDRLICGDVGFGKTEVAIRAAFKAVMSGKQVAILAPTTVLAQQHFHTFRERMSDYPITIEMLSRYRTAKQQAETVRRLATGGVDIVIGTHRLISKDVIYKDLGLAVIDEEQRFGVVHKERFKDIFRLVDVLTLSATPIPRTLYLSLMGVKDMSTIETPPPNRFPVKTSIGPYDERAIKAALERELKRQGQVFFLHNRVKSIEGVRKKLQQLVPEARIAIGHGQMDEHDLEDIMDRFVRHEFDILVCTTIIESGIDIPNANTIIIDRADRFGLADLYQLRGRVGRADHRAYALLMLPPDMLTGGDARKRMNAIKQYSQLGAGFKIAMRDLEIRGAGNLLGTQQSGHIAAIGFDMYCKLLKQSVSTLSGDAAGQRIDVSLRIDFLCTNEAEWLKAPDNALPAFIPSSYMPESQLRITAYRHLAEASAMKDLKQIRSEWIDRFGPLPEAARYLLECAELKMRASHRGISSLDIRENKLMLKKRDKFLQVGGRFPRLKGKSEAKKLQHALELVQSL